MIKTNLEAKTNPYESTCVQKYIMWQVNFSIEKRQKENFEQANLFAKSASDKELDAEVSEFYYVIQ